MVSYHRGQIIRFALFFYGSGGRTDVLSHIYNPSKPPFDKGGLWQGFALHCFAIVIVASKSCKKRLEISIWCPTIEEIRKGFLFFFVACKRCYYVAFVPQWWVATCASTPDHLPLHHATFGGTLATITLTVCIGGSATHLNVGGCADRVESIARPLVCAIMYPRYGFAVRVLSHIYNPPKPSFDKEGLWQGSALHCFAIVIVAFSACNNRLEISILSPTKEDKSQDVSSSFSIIFL